MALRVLHIIPTLERAGSGKQLALLATHLPRDQFDVHVCALTRGGPLTEELQKADIPVHVLGMRWTVDPLAYWKLRRHIRRVRPEIVHTWSLPAGVYGRRAAIAQRFTALIHSERGSNRPNHWQRWLESRLANHTSRLVVNTALLREGLLALGVPREKIAVIPDGVPPAIPSGVEREDLLQELDLPPDARLIGAVGRLVPQKHVKDLIWAAELVSVLHPSVHLLVIGEGHQRSDLERFASLTSSLDRARFLGHRDDVGRILPHLDVLWQGSPQAGSKSVILEAMAAGVPVVAADTPANRELVVGGRTGYLVPVAGRADYARTTDRLLSDAELARQLGDAGRQRVAENFSVEQTVQMHMQLYRDVMRTDETR